MNEITRIHLARQPFNISVDAKKLLENYLNGIKDQAGDDQAEILQEVESRMTELLAEKNVVGDKVILASDVEFLRAQLGEPHDFADQETDEAEEIKPKSEPSTAAAKRLFRDPDNGMIAGVCAGLATFFGLDPVVVRLIFVLLAVFSGGTGIVLYLVLWLVVPEAKTTSQKLQMKGKQVNLETLQKIVKDADVPGATMRATRAINRCVQFILNTVSKTFGLFVMVAGACGLFGIGTFMVALLTKNNAIFPKTPADYTVIAAAGATAFVLLMLVIFVGEAMFRKTWPVKSWLTATLLLIAVIGASVAAGLSINNAPKLNARYKATWHSSSQNVAEFKSVSVKSGNTPLVIQQHSSEGYRVELLTQPGVDGNAFRLEVKNGELILDTPDIGVKNTEFMFGGGGLGVAGGSSDISNIAMRAAECGAGLESGAWCILNGSTSGGAVVKVYSPNAISTRDLPGGAIYR